MAEDLDVSGPPQAGRRVLAALRPRSLLDYWTWAAFLIAVVRLFLLSGLDIDVLVLFLLPPLGAMVARSGSDRPSTRLLASVFLTLVGLGTAIAPAEFLFPELSRINESLSSQDNRILAWYLAVYLIYGLAVLPPVLCVRGLIDTRRGLPGGFSRFTYVLGLVAWPLVGPGVLWVCVERMGVWLVIAG